MKCMTFANHSNPGLPPDVEPIAQQRRDRSLGAILLLFGAFGAGAIGYALRMLVEWGGS